MTKEEQLPFGEKAMKECRAVINNIEGSSEQVWLQVGTSGI
jgi:hypothetical protein